MKPESMNVLQVHTRDQGGGGSQMVSEINQRLNKRNGIISKLLVREKSGSSNEVIELEQSFPERALDHIVERVLSLEGLGSPRSLRLPNWINKWDIDLVHLHNIHGYYFNFLNIARIPEDVALLWTFHDMWPLTGNCTYAYGCEKYQETCRNCPQLNEYPQLRLDTTPVLHRLKRRLFDRDYSIAVPSEWMLDHIRKSHLHKPTMHNVPNGIDIKRYRPLDCQSSRDKYDIKQDQIVILFAASGIHSPRKGFSFLINALENLETKSNITLLAIGGDNLPRNQFDDSFTVRNPGYIPELEVPAAYSAADLCVIPSRAESFGLVATEAMACGTPVVAFEVGGLAEQITEKTGWLVPSEDTEALGETIQQAIDNVPNHSMSEEARERAVNNYDINRCVTQYSEIYKNLLSSQ